MRRRVPDYTRYIAPSENPYPKGWLDQYRDAWHLLHLETGDVERKEEPCGKGGQPLSRSIATQKQYERVRNYTA